LHTANFANSRSINAIASALSSFKSAMSGINFKPCKAVINYKLANLMNEGKLNDTTELHFGVIKGLYISNWEGVREYSREKTTDELKDAEARQQADDNDERHEANAEARQQADDNDERHEANAEARQQADDNDERHEANAEARQQADDNDERHEANAEARQQVESLKKEHDKETFEHLADSTNVKLDGLSTLFEQINNTIDWKEYLNG
jgi:DNA anti-recombination protein RmuC